MQYMELLLLLVLIGVFLLSQALAHVCDRLR